MENVLLDLVLKTIFQIFFLFDCTDFFFMLILTLKNILLILILRFHHQNLGHWSLLMAYKQWGIFIVLHWLQHWVYVFAISSEGSYYYVSIYDKQGRPEYYSKWVWSTSIFKIHWHMHDKLFRLLVCFCPCFFFSTACHIAMIPVNMMFF